jgi:hypothetical protein
MWETVVGSVPTPGRALNAITLLPVRSELTEPHPPSVQCQIKNADKYAGDH